MMLASNRDATMPIHNTLDLAQAADFLGINKETARHRAAQGKLPGAKVGRAWRFLEEDLVTYLRSLYPDQASQGVNHRNKTIWHSTKEIKSIGLISPTMEQEYNAALGLATK
ncbi:MAG: hypothetical protein A3F10_04840 [Coxiella sp. RIFCSPHIGHO2_12_FULL_42_15]|nr:MAG: hypothetical protein A3F10_04840 [Coxiella sp. RIFCSPHIGHO2_12_FULL_42_15]